MGCNDTAPEFLGPQSPADHKSLQDTSCVARIGIVLLVQCELCSLASAVQDHEEASMGGGLEVTFKHTHKQLNRNTAVKPALEPRFPKPLSARFPPLHIPPSKSAVLPPTWVYPKCYSPPKCKTIQGNSQPL